MKLACFCDYQGDARQDELGAWVCPRCERPLFPVPDGEVVAGPTPLPPWVEGIAED